MAKGTLEKIQNVIITTVNFSPVVLVVLLVSWSYLAYNLSFCRALIADGNVLQGIAYLVIFQPVSVMTAWCYIVAVRTSPGYTSDFPLASPSLAQDDDEPPAGISQSLGADVGMQPLLQRGSRPSTVMVKRDGRARFCQKCNLPKYDRTHHCRTCKKCVLKMDHHCPWLNNCIGHQNHKAFYLFLVYCSIYCVIIFATTLPETLRMVNQPLGLFGLDINWPFLVFFSGLFGLFLVPFTGFHTNQLMQNRTTIESYERSNFIMGHRRNRDVLTSRYFNAWNLGRKENVMQVLGPKVSHWFIPTGKPEGDGSTYPLSSYAYDTLVEDEDISDRDLERQ
ncbi:DHHC palmitoyltransferase-domain-containing protein [Umbelopsis sp. AD052]|nr:DHHC palmitoyltransferase-domain-containing protein [Umbelopsis sp. AD052]